MRNAITTNNYHGHTLGKTVKQLEAEKDFKMLSLQMKKDEVAFSSALSKVKARKPTMTTPDDSEELIDMTENMKLDRKPTRPKLLPLLRSNSAKTRRVGLAHCVSPYSSAPPSPKAAHANLFSSSLEQDLNKETNMNEVQRAVSLRLSRSTTSSPILTAKLPKADAPSSPATVHRGLAIRPLSLKSTTKQTSKEKQNEKSKAVFSRLYQVQPGKPKKSIAQLMDGSPPASPRLNRRRSISMPDLSDMMEDLRNCRYLRQNSNENSQ